MGSFDHVADAYEAGRPTYPEAVFDALEPLSGALVLDGGAGTGIASRSLLRRGAHVVAFDVGGGMLTRARASTPALRAVVADGARMPFRAACADAVCFAQSWHWIDAARRCEEAARVLRAGGRWAAWWSHPRADGEAWFDRAWDLVERMCPGVDRSQRDTDWGAGISESGRFSVDPRAALPWVREVDVDTWLLDEQSKSYIAALPADAHRDLLDSMTALVHERFPDGRMTVRYETRLWIARKL